MSQVDAKLSQLRGLFVIYFVALLGVEIYFGRNLWKGGEFGHIKPGPGLILALSLFFAGVLFVSGLWMFHNLLQKKNWARIVLLIVGWLAVFDAVSSYLITADIAGFGHWLGRLVPGMDWGRALLLDRVKDFLGLLFWGYTIYILQFLPEVKQLFSPPEKE